MNDGFDRETISTLAADVVKAKAAANAYHIAVIEAAEFDVVDSAVTLVRHPRR
jgi:hypothetical protein